jgi:hypothetical protein
MTTTQEKPGFGPRLQAWLAYFGQHRRETAYGLLVAGALLVLPAYLGFKNHEDYLAVGIAAALLSLTAILAGVWFLAGESAVQTMPDDTRIGILVLGGVCGLILTIVAVVLAIRWSDVFLGGVEKWRGPDWWKIWECLGFLLGGLALMFGSFLLGRTLERSNAVLRRLLYGYNAVLTGLLLFAVLVVFNLLLYALADRGVLSPTYDCTKSGIYTLSSRSQNMLEQLDKPVTVYVLMPIRSSEYNEVITLLDNCREYTDKIKVESVSPDQRRAYELRKDYPFNGRSGLLVVYGSGAGAPYDFISFNDLFSADRRDPREPREPGRKETFNFKGEDALMSRLSFLTEQKPLSPTVQDLLKKPATVYALFADNDPTYRKVKALLDEAQTTNKELRVESRLEPDSKQAEELRKKYPGKVNERSGLLFESQNQGKAAFGGFFGPNQLFQRWVVYFTQGNNELDLNDMEMSIPDRGLSELKRRLEQGGYEVRGLQLVSGPAGRASNPQLEVSNRVPDNAGVVVIARPQIPFAAHAVAALREYMDRRTDGKKKGKLVVLADVVATRDGRMVKTGLEDFVSEFGVKIGDGQVVQLVRDARSREVVVVPNVKGSQSPLVPLFGRAMVWPDIRQLQVSEPSPGSSYSTDMVAMTIPNTVYVTSDLRLPRPTEADVQTEPVPVVVAVSERTPGGEGKPEPRLLVFGDATFISNAYLAEASGDPYFDLFASSLGWLHERPANIGIAPKKRDYFFLEPTAKVGELVWLPVGLMLVGIIGLGAGVWVVRRR